MASQPVAVHIPVGPPRAEELIYLPANEPLVLAYPCLPWVQHVAAGGAQQQASLPQFVAIVLRVQREAMGSWFLALDVWHALLYQLGIWLNLCAHCRLRDRTAC